MPNLYTTKSLGRTWIPPPTGTGSPGRFGSRSPLSSPSLQLDRPPLFRWSSSSSDGQMYAGSWKPPSKWRGWSKVHERILLAATLVLLTWYFCFHSDLQIHSYGVYWTQYLRWRTDAEVELELRNVTWKDFAYVTYATNTEYLCNSVMMMESLWRLGARAERVILHSDQWSTDSKLRRENGTETYTIEARLLQQAQSKYNAVLQPIQVQRIDDDTTWGDSFTKLLAFNQTQYRRILALDSDSTILQPMDELFLLPPTPVAMPRAYWLPPQSLFDAITLLTPSASSHARIQTAIAQRAETDFDMDIMNTVFGDSCLVLPHRAYALVTGEFRKQEHAAYLGEEGEGWDAREVLGEAKFVHFSDWPLPKPWVAADRGQREEVRPRCVEREGVEDCSDREVWEGLYKDFRERRKAICGPEMASWETETDWEVARLLADPVSSGSPREEAS